MEIDVLAPDVNHSAADFGVDRVSKPGENSIRFGLTSIKGVGGPAADAVVMGRGEEGRASGAQAPQPARGPGGPYTSIFDLTTRVDLRAANKSTLEALIKAGAADNVSGHRAQKLAALESAIRAAATEQADRRAGQMSLLGGDAIETAPEPTLPDCPRLTDQEMLQFEKDLTGRYWSSHPLAEHEELLRNFASHAVRDVQGCHDQTPVVLAGLVIGVQERVIQRGKNEGKKMARFKIEGFNGTVDAVVFSDAYAQYRELLTENRVLFFAGDVDASRDEASVRVSDVYLPEHATRELAGTVHVALAEDISLMDAEDLIREHKGNRPLLFVLTSEAGLRIAIRADEAYNVDASPEFLNAAKKLFGERGVRVRAAPPKRKERKSFKRRAPANN